MNTILPIIENDPQTSSLLKKMTASFPSRNQAQKAIRALRRAGYPAGSIRILHSPSRAALDREGFYDIFAKYLRHLADPHHVLIGVTHSNLETARRIFLDMGADVAVNRFFHQKETAAHHRLKKEGAPMMTTRLWLE